MKQLLLVFSFIFYNQVSAQDSIQIRHIIEFSYTPVDFFLNYKASCGNPNHAVIVGFGINRTVFQQRFYPQLGYQYSKQFKIINAIHIKPYAQLTVSRLKVSTAGAHYWLNPELGCNLEFGQKRRIGAGAGYRTLFEFWRDNKQGNRSIDYGVAVNLYYVF